MIVPTFLYWLLLHAIPFLVSRRLGRVTNFEHFDNGFGFTRNLTGGQWGLLILSNLIAYAIWAYALSAFLSGCMDIADGRPVTIGSFFKPRNGMAFVTALLAILLIQIGLSLCIIPGLVLGILLMFAVPFAIDRPQSANEGLRSSFSLTTSRFLESLLVWLTAAALVIVGELACGVGALVTVPLASLLVIYAYRRLSGGHVAPLEQPGYQPGPPPAVPPAPLNT